MTPDEVMAVATVAGVIVAALFGISGFVVGLVGLHHANMAKEAAAGANLIAKDANSIAKARTRSRPRPTPSPVKPTTSRGRAKCAPPSSTM